MSSKGKQIRAWVIDPETRTYRVTEVLDHLDNWQDIVGGHIEGIMNLGRGNEVYANEMGMYKSPHYWWTLGNGSDPLVPIITGPGFIVRRLRGRFAHTTITEAMLVQHLKFLDKDEARSRYNRGQAARHDMVEVRRRAKPDLHIVEMHTPGFPED
jgi:hypothetical protein